MHKIRKSEHKINHIVRIYLFETQNIHENLLPLSFTRPVADFRIGILTIREKWEKEIAGEFDYIPVDYLKGRFQVSQPEKEVCLFIRGNLLPEKNIIEKIKCLTPGQALLKEEELLGFCGKYESFLSRQWESIEFKDSPRQINYVFDLFLENYAEIAADFERVTKNRVSAKLPDCVRRLSSDEEGKADSMIFIEEGAVVECATLNVDHGPIYIGKNAVLMEGACVRGPLAVCEGSEVRMGSKIYGGTTIGPHCKIGGEVDNTVIFGFSNKAHDGYLGNAVIGEWCNIGAGVNASNLKNDYSLIRIWNYRTRSFMKTDLQFCGLIMGDHSKIGVNCMVNTATVMGVGVNLHGSGFPRTYLSNFCEGSAGSGFSEVPFRKFIDIAERVMARRDINLCEKEKEMYAMIYSDSIN